MALAGWNDRVRIENPLSSMSDEEVRIDATRFVNSRAPFLSDKVEDVCRAAHVAKHIRFYEYISRGYNSDGSDPPITLTREEKEALVREKDKVMSESGMWFVFITISLAAFLQGFVQSSFSGANVYEGYWRRVSITERHEHEMGLTNGIAYLAAALIGCPVSDIVNQVGGRKGAILIAAVLIAASSLGAGLLQNFDEDGTGRSIAWKYLVILRLFNGIGMGIKAVSTPILASETAIGYWRGTVLLMWQLWVALGILMCNGFNLFFFLSPRPIISLRLILASPTVPALMLIISLYFVPESPRFYLRPHRGNYKPEAAYQCLRRLRNTELQALRDLYLVHRSVSLEGVDNATANAATTDAVNAKPKISVRRNQYFARFYELFVNPRLRNSTISSCIVALGQQLCGINIFAFYSTSLFLKVLEPIKYDGAEDANRTAWRNAMLYSLGFGMANFLFGIPAVGTIDTFGRRKWLLVTIPGMALAFAAAAASLEHPDAAIRQALTVIFMLVHTMFYSPAMGPVPFTLASESFPLSHRENGCSVAVMVNLFFAGILAWFYPLLDGALSEHGKPGENPKGGGGALGIFSGFNVVAFVLIYFLVEETKQRSLEDLEQIYNVGKRKFARYQATVHLPYILRRWFLCSDEAKPDFYDDATKDVTRPDEEMAEMSPPGSPAKHWDRGPYDVPVDDRPGSRSRYE